MDVEGIDKVDAKTLREKIYEQLRERIIYGDIMPGHTVTLRNLASQFGVSVIPVRDALLQLKSEGVIEFERNKLIRVSVLTAKELEEILAIRLDLELRVARRAGDSRDESILPRLHSLVEEMDNCATDPRNYLHKNSEFHFAIYHAADMPLHLQLINELWARVAPYLYIQADEVIAVAQAMSYHRQMVKALADKDTDRLVVALRHDMEDAARFIAPHLS